MAIIYFLFFFNVVELKIENIFAKKVKYLKMS